MMNTEYFIKKFEAIPEEQWCTDYIQNPKGQKCANGHCGVHQITNMKGESWMVINEESIALQKVFSRLTIHPTPGVMINMFIEDQEYSSKAATINNKHALEYQQETPKQRILAALRDIQLLEEQDQAIAQVQLIVDEEKPDDIDTSVNVPKPRLKEKLDMVLTAALTFILNII